MKTIGLCMIVKDESHVIERCLESVKRLIDFVLIVDTGSSDNTISVIRDWLDINKIPGSVISEEWKNFAHNRSSALSKIRDVSNIDYALMIDADEIIIYDDDFDVHKFKSDLGHDFYDLKTKMGGVSYYRPQLTSNKKEFKYVCAVHEFLSCSDVISKGIINGFYNSPIQDSNRNISGYKFLKDIELIENELKIVEDDFLRARYTFYLAQSYRDSGNLEKALENYIKRSEMNFWVEEVFISIYNSGNLKSELGYPIEDIIQTHMKAYEVCPNRLESLHSISVECRKRGLHNQGYIISKHALSIKIPENSLFIESWKYEYGILDEFSIHAYYTGNFEESLRACERLLLEGKIPNNYIERIQSNMNFSIDKLRC